MTEFIRRHPKVLIYGAYVAVGVSVAGLIQSVEALHLAKQAVGVIQREASEALGG